MQRLGRALHHPLLTLRWLPNAGGECRFGFSIGRRVGKAVVRNRVRRRLRDLVRRAQIRPGVDVVIIARPAAAAASFTELQAALMHLLERARLFATPSTGNER